MIVVALIGIFFAATSYMNRDVRTYQHKAERFADNIYDTIRLARNNMVIWRGVLSGATERVVTTKRVVNISATWVTTTYYYPIWGGNFGSGIESEIYRPFFDSDPLYLISDISVSSGGMNNGIIPAWDLSGATNAGITVTGTGIQLYVSGATDIRTLMITTEYLGFKRSVLIDRVSGTLELKTSGETNQ